MASTRTVHEWMQRYHPAQPRIMRYGGLRYPSVLSVAVASLHVESERARFAVGGELFNAVKKEPSGDVLSEAESEEHATMCMELLKTGGYDYAKICGVVHGIMMRITSKRPGMVRKLVRWNKQVAIIYEEKMQTCFCDSGRHCEWADAHFDGRWVQCDGQGCNQWYHSACIEKVMEVDEQCYCCDDEEMVVCPICKLDVLSYDNFNTSCRFERSLYLISSMVKTFGDNSGEILLVTSDLQIRSHAQQGLKRRRIT